MITSETQLFQFLQLLHSRVLSTYQYKGAIQMIFNHAIFEFKISYLLLYPQTYFIHNHFHQKQNALF